MKKLSIFLTLMGACFANQASAMDFMTEQGLRPYVGLDVHWRHLEFNREIGRPKKNAVEGNPYLGIRICDFLGIEAGYEGTNEVESTYVANPGDFALGFDIVPGEPSETHKTRWQLQGGYVSLLGYTPFIFEDCTQLFAGVGISHKRFSYRDVIVADNGVPLTPAERAEEVRTLKKSKSFVRLTAGIQHMITCNLGMRATLTWENTATFKNLLATEAARPRPNALKNSTVLGAGVFYSF